MAKKVNAKVNPALIKQHSPQAPVRLVQSMIHRRFGTIHFPQPEYSSVYLELAREAHEATERVFLGLMAQYPVDSSNSRVLEWESDGLLLFLQRGFDLVLMAYLAVDIYTVERFIIAHRLGQTADGDVSGVEAIERIRTRLPDLLSCPKPPRELMSSYGEIEKARHMFMHPTAERIHAVAAKWDNVPLELRQVSGYTCLL